MQNSMIYAYFGAALLFLSSLIGNYVQHQHVSALEAQAATLTTAKDAAESNEKLAKKSAGDWEATTSTLNTKLAACNKANDDNAEANRKALAVAAAESTKASRALTAWTQKYNSATKVPSCAALLATPICPEALPNE